ncbi:MAG TPA: vitamin K epoxide reductase family protein [Methylomirabilota bacterium]|nr:vitamin K epoxide reductase family protein [Methylomirabilota bacterium]
MPKATKRKNKSKPVPGSFPVLNAARLLLGIALLTALYLGWVSLSSGAVAGCGPESDCNRVLQSRWAYWLGIPVSLPAALAYLALLVSTFFPRPDQRGNSSPGWIALRTGLAASVIGAALWFTGIQWLVLDAFCFYCLIAHTAGVVASLLLIRETLRSRLARPGDPPLRGSARRFATRAFAVAAGVAGVGVLATGQFFVVKPAFSVSQSANVQQDPAASDFDVEIPAAPRELSLHNGSFRLPVAELPLLGSPAAPHLLVSLFDYTCHHCRDLHPILRQAYEAYDGQLAIINLPMPIDSECNHLMQRTSSAHVNACRYAKLSLAVWRARPELWADFDDWLFQSNPPPPVEQATRHAAGLVGEEALNAALNDPWVEQQIQTDIQLYEANSRSSGGSQMPQLIAGNAISRGPLPHLRSLFQLLETNLGLTPPPVPRTRGDPAP